MTLPLVTKERGALISAAALGVLLCALPVVGVLGPESALGLGLVLPPVCAAMAARRGHAARQAREPGETAFLDTLKAVWLIVAIPIALLGLNALRVKTCAPLDGAAFMILGPLSGVSLAAVLGCASGLLLPRRRSAVLLAVAIPLVAMLVSLYSLWSTPAVFAYGHFFGYFPGTLYDRSVTVPHAWLWMRGVSLCIGLGAFCLARLGYAPATGLDLSGWRRHPTTTLVLLGCATLAGIGGVRGQAWGLTTSSEHIASQLGRKLRSQRCVLVVPRELPMDEAVRLGEDCDFEVGRLEAELGVEVDRPITAYFFRHGAEKRRLMGAGQVYVAKPWRDEVYLQLAGWPHPVLSHELAHVVAGEAGSGPFRIAGVWGGYAPEPTLIEGMAVALAWQPRDGLTPHQWARAAREAGVAPPLASLVGAGFFQHNQSLGYTLAGSFLRHVLDSRGAETLRRVYREGNVEGATGTPLAELERSWHAALDATPLPESARALAQLRFERPGVFSQVCPHEIERLRLELHGALGAGDHVTAAQLCHDILEIDPRHAESRARLVGALAQAGDIDSAEEALHALGDSPDTPRAILAQAKGALADAAWRAGDIARATAMVRELLDAPQVEDTLRVLQVKALALATPPEQRALFRELLVGEAQAPTDARVAMNAIVKLGTLREDGLADYLAGRQLIGAGRHDLALERFRAALSRGLPLPRLTREALRLRGESAFALGGWSEAQSSFVALEAAPEASAADEATAQRWLARVRYVERDAKASGANGARAEAPPGS